MRSSKPRNIRFTFISTQDSSINLTLPPLNNQEAHFHRFCHDWNQEYCDHRGPSGRLGSTSCLRAGLRCRAHHHRPTGHSSWLSHGSLDTYQNHNPRRLCGYTNNDPISSDQPSVQPPLRLPLRSRRCPEHATGLRSCPDHEGSPRCHHHGWADLA